MNYKLKIGRRTKYALISSIASLMIMFGCVYLDSVEVENSTVNAGDIASFTMKIHVKGEGASVSGTRLIIAVLAPKSWNIANNSTITYTNTQSAGERTMSVIPAGTKPKNMSTMEWPDALRNRFKYGPNILEDMEWVAFQSHETYDIANGEMVSAEIKMKIKTGPDNMVVKLGFLLNHSDDGMSTDSKHFKVLYTEKFYVKNGDGPVIDFCDYHLNLGIPSSATKDDILTLKFLGGIESNALDGTDEVYLNAIATTSSGNTYLIDERTDKTMMMKESAYGRTYSKTFWVADYFNIPDNEAITRINYFFTNVDGTIMVKEKAEEGEEAKPFVYMFVCK